MMQRHHPSQSRHLTDPTNPKLTWTRSYSGNRVSLRQYDDVVRVVLDRRAAKLGVHLPDQHWLGQPPQGSGLQSQNLAGEQDQ
ncbi:MAG: hypothetical protein V9G13_12910 [Marmoricola sp.]